MGRREAIGEGVGKRGYDICRGGARAGKRLGYLLVRWQGRYDQRRDDP
jgi:hypothetical protein